MKRGISIVGRFNRGGVHDYYQTPAWATEALLKAEHFSGNVLEPCCGAGAISRVLEDYNFSVCSADIRTDDNVYGKQGMDILNIKKDDTRGIDNIITNPPYNNAQAVIEKSLELADKKVAMLLKLTFLESGKRYKFFKDTPLKNVWVFCKRVTMHPEGVKKPKNSGTITFAWFVWERGYTGKPMIGWINN